MIRLNFRNILWKKILLVLLYFLGLAVFFFLGYLGAYFIPSYLKRLQGVGLEPPLAQVYRNETYLLGMRYPLDWKIQEVKTSFVIFTPVGAEGEKAPRDYIDLQIAGNANRAKTDCEKDQEECTLLVNNVSGDLISTPEKEIAFFSKEKSDFTLTLYKYGDRDYKEVFEAMAKSLRFISAPQTAGGGE